MGYIFVFFFLVSVCVHIIFKLSLCKEPYNGTLLHPFPLPRQKMSQYTLRFRTTWLTFLYVTAQTSNNILSQPEFLAHWKSNPHLLFIAWVLLLSILCKLYRRLLIKGRSNLHSVKGSNSQYNTVQLYWCLLIKGRSNLHSVKGSNSQYNTVQTVLMFVD